MVNIPLEFQGTEEQKKRNQRSHRIFEDGRCVECDCKITHTAFDYPCGQEPPRVEMPDDIYSRLQDIKIAWLNKEITRDQAIEMQKTIFNSVE